LTDKRARSGSPFRNDPKLAGVSAVWPFETGWAAKAKWLPAAHVLVLRAEIYPSVRDPLRDVKLRTAVRPAPCGSGHATWTYFDAAGRSGDNPLKDVRVRRAIAHAIDRAQFAR
jgi:hypothetical protein